MRILFGRLAEIALRIGGFFLIGAQQQDDELAQIAAPPSETRCFARFDRNR